MDAAVAAETDRCGLFLSFCGSLWLTIAGGSGKLGRRGQIPGKDQWRRGGGWVCLFLVSVDDEVTYIFATGVLTGLRAGERRDMR
ncbi:MAG: hypothetical protein AMJ46_07885 [Latescibacteria bacterium DG_63]|nr:MAG: hypothetical protein AMJ46_07885 [Latescibacteria bacterium DG_63]